MQNMNEGAKLGGILTVSDGEDYTENGRWFLLDEGNGSVVVSSKITN